MASSLEFESKVVTQLSSSMSIRGEVVTYAFFDDLETYRDILMEQGAVSTEITHLGGKRIYLHSVFDSSSQAIYLQTPAVEAPRLSGQATAPSEPIN